MSTASQLFAIVWLFCGLCLVVWGPASFLFSGWSLSRHNSYCTLTGRKRHRWFICIHFHPPASSLTYSTQLFVHTHLQWTILFLRLKWTFVKPDPSRSLHLSNSHLLSLQSLKPYLLPAPIWTCIHLAKLGREIVSSVQLELAALPHVKTMTNEDLRTVTRPISHYYTIISPFTSRASADYMPMRTVFSLAWVSMALSFLSFSISFTLFRRQWQRLFKHPEWFFRSTYGRFLQIVPNLNDNDNDVTTAFLYMTDAEFLAIKGLAREILTRSDTEITSCVTSSNTLYPDITQVYTSAT